MLLLVLLNEEDEVAKREADMMLWNPLLDGFNWRNSEQVAVLVADNKEKTAVAEEQRTILIKNTYTILSRDLFFL